MNYLTSERMLSNYVGKRSAGKPIPLKSTSYDVDIVSGIASIKMVRKFRNDEGNPIEATITFPVPFEAVVYGVETKIDDRVLKGVAKAKVEARSDYETAIDQGKAAVLHEELLRGLHMVSVANVAPGAEIEVTAKFAMPLALAKGAGVLTIPQTVGDIYGASPLMDSDDILNDGPVEMAEVTVRSETGAVTVNAKKANNEPIKVETNCAIKVRVKKLYEKEPKSVRGTAADGKTVEMSFSVPKVRKTALCIDVLLDTSGSMTERVTSIQMETSSKWEASKKALSDAAEEHLSKRDHVRMWTFASDCVFHGEVKGDRFSEYVKSIPQRSGGTELAGAIDDVVSANSEANVLLITDGRSWTDIDVQKAVASGARFTVVLVGEAALEGKVGYLASMTGGRMFVSNGTDLKRVTSSALSSMRGVGNPVVPITAIPASLQASVAGSDVLIEWKKKQKKEDGAGEHERAVSAYAAHVAMRGMEGEIAAEYAAKEGIVSHLTSIVLVDDAGEAVEGVPATRKVPLATPVNAMVRSCFGLVQQSAMMSCNTAVPTGGAQAMALTSHGGWGLKEEDLDLRSDLRNVIRPGRGRKMDLSGMEHDRWMKLLSDSHRYTGTSLKGVIQWDRNPNELKVGDTSSLPYEIEAKISEASKLVAVKKLATKIGVSPEAVVIALIARADADASRTAARISRSILEGAAAELVDKANDAIGLS